MTPAEVTTLLDDIFSRGERGACLCGLEGAETQRTAEHTHPACVFTALQRAEKLT